MPHTLSQHVEWWEESVGPGCVDGNLVYPGIPGYVTCPDPEEAETTLITNWDDCASYFRCYELTPVLECCPKGLLYDPPMRVCDDPPHVYCGSRPILDYPATTTAEPTTTTTTTPEPTTTTPEPTTTTPEPTTTTPEPTTTTPEPTTTTPEPTTTTPEPTTTTTTTPEPTTTTPEPTTTTPEPTTTTPEPTTTTPEPTTTTPEPTTTTPEPTTTTTTPVPTTTTPVPAIDPKCHSMPGYTGRLPVEDDCTKYYQCDGTTTGPIQIVTCPIDPDFGQMVYNPTSQECDYQWHYPCDDHKIHPRFPFSFYWL